ncbi:MAG TPA: DUF3108 domain-containing protein [Gammaproteobacteria bacterium]|nr:DUF3108 domain-containing protein [Gammaproteobacteria bacterium]
MNVKIRLANSCYTTCCIFDNIPIVLQYAILDATGDLFLKGPQNKIQFNFLTFLGLLILWTLAPGIKAHTRMCCDKLPLPEYEAHYQISWHGIKSGRSHHKLYRRQDGSYHVEVKSTPYLTIVPIRHFESSEFIFQKGKIKPLNYQYNIREARRHKQGNVKFDWQNKTLTNSLAKDPWIAPLPFNIQDKLTHTLMLRLDLKKGLSNLTYPVAENDKFKTYTFTVLGFENIQTKIGTLETLKLEHVSQRGYRTTLWLAKKLDYLPILVNQARQGTIIGRAEIISLTNSTA